MADELKITITATDGASKVFTAVERSAKEMGEGIETAAEKAGGEFKEMVAAASQMEAALSRHADSTGASMTALGQSIDRLATQLDTSLSGGARDAGTALNTVETEAEQTAAALDRTGDSTQRAGVNLQQLGAAGQTAAQGLALIGTSFVMYANQARDYDMAVAALGRTYGETAGQFVQLANSMQSTTIFSNDQVVEAANLMGTLQRNYQMTSAEIQQLITISADLAAVNGISLADAAQRVAAAMRGEAESAEVLGLTMNDAAIGIDRLGASATEAEKAQFRLNAITEQSAFALGAAADQANTTTGEVQQLANKVQDAVTGFVDWTGPIGEVAAGLGSFGIEAGIAVGGLARLVQGMGQATTAAGGLGNVLKGLAGSPTVGFAALAIGTGVAVVGFRELSRAIDGDFNRIVAEATETSANLDAAILSLTGTLTDASTVLSLTGVTAGLDQVQSDLERIRKLQQEINLGVGGETGVAAFDIADEDFLELQRARQAELDGLIAKYGDTEAAAKAWAAAESDLASILIYSGAGAEGAQARALELTEAYNAGQMSLEEYAWNLNWVTENYQTYATQAAAATVATEAANAAMTTNNNAMLSNGNVVRDSEEAIHQWAMAVAEGNTAVETETAALTENTDAVLANTNAKLSNGNVVRDSEEAIHQWAMAVSEGNMAAEDQTTTLDQNTEAASRNADQFRYYAEALYDTTGSVEEFTRAIAEVPPKIESVVGITQAWAAQNQALTETFGPQIENVLNLQQHMNELAVSTERVDRTIGVAAEEVQRGQDIWTDYNDALTAVVESFGELNAATASGILQDTTGTILGQTRSWGQLSQSVADWAGGLAHGLLAQTKLDQAFLSGLISRRTYREALEANHEIQVANAEIQEDLLRIQIKQMPIMAQAIQQQATYIDGLADQDAASQLAALGFMDQAQSMKALEVAQLAATSTTEGQQAATTAMIQEMAAADPVLAAMLEKMGLISIGADGTITVNFDDADNATSAIEDLNDSVKELTGLLADIFNVDTETDAPETQGLIENLTGAANAIPTDVKNVLTSSNAPETTGTVYNLTAAINNVPRETMSYLNASDGVSGVVTQAEGALNRIDGRTVTTYIQTVEVSGRVQTAGRLGGVMGYSNGGMVMAQLAEAGPELLSFRDGTDAIVPHPGVYMVERGTSVTTAPATAAVLENAARSRGGRGVNFYGPVTLQPVGQDAYGAISSAAVRRGR